MAPHIVSWGASAPAAASPASSSSPSVVSFDSIPSDILPPTVPATETGIFSADSSMGEPSASPTPASTYPTGIDDSFLRHDTYFFKDGNITFLVDGTLYCVHRFFFSRDSVYFSTRLAQLGIRDHEALTTVVALGDVEREDFEALLSVIYPKDFEEHNLSYQQWKSVLHLSTRWGFASIRKLALKSINPPTPHDRLVLARTYAVNQWVVPALAALCQRVETLTLTEARQMRIEDVVLVAAVREEVRNRVLSVFTDPAKITRSVEAALAGNLPSKVGDGAFPSSLAGGAAKQGAAKSPVDAEREEAAQNGDPKYFTQWLGKGVGKSPEEPATQGVGKATPPEQATQPEGEREPKPFGGNFGAPAQAAVGSLFGSFSKQRPMEGKQASKAQRLSANAEKPTTSTHETATPNGSKHPFSSPFSFGQGSATTPVASVGTPLFPVESGPSSPEPATKQSNMPEVTPVDSKAPWCMGSKGS